MAECLSNFGGQFISLLLALLAYLFGLRAFYLQKEYELVRQRYLVDGLELLANDVEHALSIDIQLFQQGLNLVRQFREAGNELPSRLRTQQAPQLDMSRLRTIPNYRVQTLTGSDAFWEGTQLVYARVQEFADFYEDELLHTIDNIVEGRYELARPQSEFLDLATNAVQIFHNAISADFHELLFLLRRLDTELEKRRLTLRDVHRFKKRREVRQIVIEANALIETIKERPRPHSLLTQASPKSHTEQ